MRLRVGGNRVALEQAKARKGAAWRKSKAMHANMNGRVQLKDLKGSSYMKLGFYRRVPLDSEKYIIVNLSDKRPTKAKQKAQNFEFRKMADRYKSRDLNESQMNLLDATGLESQMHDVTKENILEDS